MSGVQETNSQGVEYSSTRCLGLFKREFVMGVLIGFLLGALVGALVARETN